MTVYKCDRCGVLCEPKKVVGYDFCDMCYRRFVDFLNMSDCSPEGVRNQLMECGQRDKRFHLGETILYSPYEVEKILNGEYEDETKNGSNNE